MSKIDWRKRFKNKVFLLAMAGAVIAFVYQILGLIGIVPSISQDSITQTVGMIVNILVAFGIVADPTTPGVADHNYSGADAANGFDEETEPDKEGK